MSAMQTGNHHPSNGLIQTGNKFGNLVGFGGFGNIDKSLRPNSRSPPLEKQCSPQEPSHLGTSPPGIQPSGEEMTRSVWDPYFERKINHNEEPIRVSSPPTGNLPPPSAQRGEGLAA